MRLRIQDLAIPGKAATYSLNGGGWKSVEELQQEIIRRLGNHWLTDDPRYFNLRVADKIEKGVITWLFSDAKGHWIQDQQITLEEEPCNFKPK